MKYFISIIFITVSLASSDQDPPSPVRVFTPQIPAPNLTSPKDPISSPLVRIPQTPPANLTDRDPKPVRVNFTPEVPTR